MSDETNGRPGDRERLSALEAILFAAGEPVQLRELAEAFDDLGEDELRDTIDALERDYERRGSGLQVERVAGGIRLATRPSTGSHVRQFFRKRHRTRLSRAALETLAIVAYRQPITAPEIQAIRGVDPSGPLRSLVEKKLIRILGRKKVVGNPLLYGTSREFLVHFGLDSLEDLPSLAQFEELVGSLAQESLVLDEEARPAQSGTGAPPPEEAASPAGGEDA